MDNETVIKVENVSKKYCKSLRRSIRYGVMDIGRNLFGLSSKSDQLRKDEFWALNDISFEVKRGETLGIIGPNGSGKTTLLKLLNGIFWPDKGVIKIKGRVGALIELGAGFHPMLTGRENIYINAAILGMTKNEVDKKFDEIVDFADIGNFIDTPVKYYSSGMYARLGFAVAVYSYPDILLVDEVLAVGDTRFWLKSIKKLKELNKHGMTILVVTHNMWIIQTFCNRAICLYNGGIVAEGNPLKIIYVYKNMGPRDHRKKMLQTLGGQTKILRFEIHREGEWASEKEAYPESGVKVIIRGSIEKLQKIAFFVRVTSQDGVPYFTLYSEDFEAPVSREIVCECIIPKLMLKPGEYIIWGGICSSENEDDIIDEEKYSIIIKDVDIKYNRFSLTWNIGNWRFIEE